MTELAENGGRKGFVLGLTLVATLGGLLFGYDTAVISGAIGFLESHFNLSTTGVGWAASCALVGCVPGALSAGWLNQTFGRRATLIISAPEWVCIWSSYMADVSFVCSDLHDLVPPAYTILNVIAS